MRYLSTLLILITMSFTIVNAQKVFYADKNKGDYHIWRSGIVGKVKNNIIVWKYLLPGKKLELLVYDYDMKLKRSILVKGFFLRSFTQGCTVSAGNLLYVLFPQEISKSKRMLKQVIVTSNGEAIFKPVISNNFHYLFQTQQGVQIDKHSIVFPCEVKGYLSFARVEFD